MACRRPKLGELTRIGSLGFDTSDLVGFDISGASGAAFAALTPPTGSVATIHVDLTTGAATLVGTIGTGLTLTGLAADVGTAAVPAPSALVLLGIGGLGLLAVARRRR